MKKKKKKRKGRSPTYRHLERLDYPSHHYDPHDFEHLRLIYEYIHQGMSLLEALDKAGRDSILEYVRKGEITASEGEVLLRQLEAIGSK